MEDRDKQQWALKVLNMKYSVQNPVVVYDEMAYQHSVLLWALGLKSKNLGGVK